MALWLPNANWAGNFEYHAQLVNEPRSATDVQEIMQRSLKLKVIGTRHSFNHIADTNDTHISLKHLNKVIALDPKAQTVTVEGGVVYGDLAAHLHENGFALHNLASLPHISVAGAIATATHGSGEKNGNLGTAVRGLEVVNGLGEIVTFAGDDLPGAVVNLGALGIVTKITLAVEPAYQMQQRVYVDLPFAQMLDHFDAIQASAYSVSFFTDWRGDAINQVWLKQRATDPQPDDEFFGATPATEALHMIPGVSPENCTEQLGIDGAWHARLPHFKMDFTPSSGEELQSEYFVPRSEAIAGAASCA